MKHKTIADRLKYSLYIRDMTQKDLSKQSGVAEATINRYCQGAIQPGAKSIVAICRTLGISSDWLLGIIEESMK